jgi:hypothetical protein
MFKNSHVSSCIFTSFLTGFMTFVNLFYVRILLSPHPLSRTSSSHNFAAPSILPSCSRRYGSPVRHPHPPTRPIPNHHVLHVRLPGLEILMLPHQPDCRLRALDHRLRPVHNSDTPHVQRGAGCLPDPVGPGQRADAPGHSGGSAGCRQETRDGRHHRSAELSANDGFDAGCCGERDDCQ